MFCSGPTNEDLLSEQVNDPRVASPGSVGSGMSGSDHSGSSDSMEIPDIGLERRVSIYSTVVAHTNRPKDILSFLADDRWVVDDTQPPEHFPDFAFAQREDTEIMYDDVEGQIEAVGDTQNTLNGIKQGEPATPTPTDQGHSRGTTEMQSKISLSGLNDINDFLQTDLQTLYDEPDLEDDAVCGAINALETITESPAME